VIPSGIGLYQIPFVISVTGKCESFGKGAKGAKVKLFPSIIARARRLLAVLGGAALALGVAVAVPAAASTGSATTARAAASHGSGWVASWGASPMAGSTSFSDQTVRNIIFTSAGGSSLRVQLTNTFGTSPLQVGAVSVGVVLDGSQLLPGTSRTVTFGGKTSVTIPAGTQELSDPLAFKVQPLTELAVSVYLPDATGPATNHSDAQQNNYIAAGDHVSDSAPTAYTSTTGSWYFVDGLDVYNRSADGTVVAFGDSITDGYQSLTGANARWPNYLARRLDAALGNRAPGVVDEGISGNRILSDSTCYGVSALSRFGRDALSEPGVKTVILLEGINDIGFAGMPDSGCSDPNNAGVTAAQIEAGYRTLITEAHAKGVKIYAGTLMPFAGSNSVYGGYFGTAYGEQLREQVNTWIETSHAFDGVINFAQVMADPYDPQYLNPAYDANSAPNSTADSLHPNDVGYEVMANAIPLGYVK
jgi:lysophospholipase L1-like esterase